MLSLDMTDVQVRFAGLDSSAFHCARLTIPAGEHVAVVGPSGSGKSTFVNIVTGLERPSTGTIRWKQVDIASLSEAARDKWRGANVGLIMQDFHLFPGLSAIENTLLPARLARAADRVLQQRAAELLTKVGLHRPTQMIETMSRGEMQRVAVARALLREPGIIVADEPTASLDAVNSNAIGELLVDLATQTGATLIVVSHDHDLIAKMPRRLALTGGAIVLDQEMERH